MARYYRLLLDDFSAASFTSFSKSYFGTLEQMKGLFDYIRSDEDIAKRFSGILSVYDRYLAGETEITHGVAYQDVPFLVTAKLLWVETSVLTDYDWTHFNTWEWPYYMKCDKAESTHAWFSCRKKYCRCNLTQFTNLQYGTSKDDYEPLGRTFWGYPGQIQGEVGNLHNQLYVAEKWFDSKAEAFNDWMNFKQNHDPDFSSFLEDVFGDG